MAHDDPDPLVGRRQLAWRISTGHRGVDEEVVSISRAETVAIAALTLPDSRYYPLFAVEVAEDVSSALPTSIRRRIAGAGPAGAPSPTASEAGSTCAEIADDDNGGGKEGLDDVDVER